MNRHFIAFAAIIVLGAAGLVTYYFLRPYFTERHAQSTSDASQVGERLVIGTDSWIGYVPLCGKEMRRRMHESGYRVECRDDKADYPARMKQLRSGDLQFAVATVDTFLLNGAKEQFPGTIVMVIDESKGGDALVARRDKLASIEDLKTRSGYRIAYTPSSPSEHLLKAVASHFDVPSLRQRDGAWRVPVTGSEEALEQLLKGKVDAAVLWEPDVAKATAQSGIVKILGTEDTQKLIVDVLLVNRDFSQHSATAVSRLMATYFRTLKYYRDNPEALTDEIRAATKLSRGQAETAVKGVRWASLTENARDWFGVGGGTEGLVDTLEETAKILVDHRDFPASPLPQRDPYRLQYRKFVEDLFTAGMDSTGFNTPASDAAATASRSFPALTPEQWSRLPEVGTLRIRPISFASGTDDLSLEGKAEIDAAAVNLSRYPNFRIIVKGHTSIRGDRNENKLLSQERAEAVKRYLTITHAIDAQRIHAVGYGGDRPLARSPGEADRAYEYRLPRVEISLASDSY